MASSARVADDSVFSDYKDFDDIVNHQYRYRGQPLHQNVNKMLDSVHLFASVHRLHAVPHEYEICVPSNSAYEITDIP